MDPSLRDYRKGNWTVEETLVLIEAKRMDDQRRMNRLGDGGKPTELRWKWVEDYCWKNRCLRSQNQCNDKWDNLMRDFKKVREYERLAAEIGEHHKSYWEMERNERKDNSLPSNMLLRVYNALLDVVECSRAASVPINDQLQLQYSALLLPPPLPPGGPSPQHPFPLPGTYSLQTIS